MKYKLLSKSVLFILLLSFFASCDLLKQEEKIPPEDVYLVSFERYKTYLPAFIKTMLGQYEDVYPDLSKISDKVEHGIAVYKIQYNTVFQGENIIASGLVSVPLTEGAYPILSYQNGTNTLHSNAPSVNPDSELFLLLESLASTGFIISVPDYLGFGITQNMFHPYLHAESTVNAVTDMLKAVKEMVNHYLDIRVIDDLYIAGYSQGGWATMQTQKVLEQEFAGEFDLKASACGAGPYDLNFINQYVIESATYPMPYFLAYNFHSFSNLGIITNPASDMFQEPYASRIPGLFDGTKSGDEINEELTTNPSDLFTADYRANVYESEKYTSIVTSLTDNSVEAWATSIPTRILHGTADNYVPTIVSTNMFKAFLEQGVSSTQVALVPLPGYDHPSCIIPSGIASFLWFLELRDEE